jgi:hypothetical protein
MTGDGNAAKSEARRKNLLPQSFASVENGHQGFKRGES